MNERYVVDAYAWIEYLIGSEAGSKVKAALDEEKSEIHTCTVTVAEVVGKTTREGRDPESAYDILISNSQIIDADVELSKEAGMLHAKLRQTVRDFGLADAYVLATARRTNSRILTGDPHFKTVREAIPIE